MKILTFLLLILTSISFSQEISFTELSEIPTDWKSTYKFLENGNFITIEKGKKNFEIILKKDDQIIKQNILPKKSPKGGKMFYNGIIESEGNIYIENSRRAGKIVYHSLMKLDGDLNVTQKVELGLIDYSSMSNSVLYTFDFSNVNGKTFFYHLSWSESMDNSSYKVRKFNLELEEKKTFTIQHSNFELKEKSPEYWYFFTRIQQEKLFEVMNDGTVLIYRKSGVYCFSDGKVKSIIFENFAEHVIDYNVSGVNSESPKITGVYKNGNDSITGIFSGILDVKSYSISNFSNTLLSRDFLTQNYTDWAKELDAKKQKENEFYRNYHYKLTTVHDVESNSVYGIVERYYTTSNLNTVGGGTDFSSTTDSQTYSSSEANFDDYIVYKIDKEGNKIWHKMIHRGHAKSNTNRTDSKNLLIASKDNKLYLIANDRIAIKKTALITDIEYKIKTTTFSEDGVFEHTVSKDLTFDEIESFKILNSHKYSMYVSSSKDKSPVPKKWHVEVVLP